MNLIIYIFSASFFLMSLALMFTYRRTSHYGTFVMGLTYAAAAGLALAMMHWWPLVVGFVAVWVMKLLGLEPKAPKDSEKQPPSPSS